MFNVQEAQQMASDISLLNQKQEEYLSRLQMFQVKISLKVAK